MIWTVSSNCYFNDLKLLKTPEPIRLGLFRKKPWSNPKT